MQKTNRLLTACIIIIIVIVVIIIITISITIIIIRTYFYSFIGTVRDRRYIMTDVI